MPQIKRLLKDATVEIAAAARICHRNRANHRITKGESCLVVKQPEGGKRNYCSECANEILDQAADDLESLRSSFA